MIWSLLLACHTPGGSPKDESPAPDTAESAETAPDSAESAETADSAETAETGDTGDTGESGDSAETGDTGEPEPTPALVFEGRRPTNLLVISLDTTRRDQLGVFSGLDTTPFWDGVLTDSVLLADHVTCSNWTAPSMICATTGRFPVDDGYWPTSVYNSSASIPVPPIPDGLPTVAAWLGDQGWTTSLITSNGVYSPNNCEGISHGYQRVLMPLWYPAQYVADYAAQEAHELVTAGDPWFLHVHFIDPHTPYMAPAEYLTEAADLDAKYHFPWNIYDPNSVYTVYYGWSGMSPEEREQAYQYLQAVYRAELRYWDHEMSELWEQLEFMGALDDTLVVFWTDHGEQHGEHERFFHGVSLFPEENRATAAFWARDLVPARWEGPTVHQDIFPTIAEAMGLDAPPEAQGSVVGLAPGDRTLTAFNYLVGYSAPVASVTRSGHKLIYYFDGEKHYYDVAADPDATTDLYDPKDPTVVDLWRELNPFVQQVITQWPYFSAVDRGP